VAASAERGLARVRRVIGAHGAGGPPASPPAGGETRVAVAPWTCPGCGAAVATRFCADCGERSPSPRDLTLRGFLRQAAGDLTSIDGRLVRSLRCLLGRPGALTVAFVEGRRKAYIPPFQLFLVANVLFFATQSLTHANVLSSPLASHLHLQDWQVLARSLVAHRLEAKGTTLAAYTPVFDQAVVLNAKSLIALMVVPFALLLPVMFYGTRRPFVAHLVFSLHFHAFLLLFFCATLVVLFAEAKLGGAGLNPRADIVVSALILACCAAYLYRATGTVYGARGTTRVARAVVLALAMGGIVLGYRFVIFLVTLYTT
jgi:hypothetical protein